MRLYIWDYVSPVSGSWHSGGAVLVVAKDVKDARKQWSEHVAENNEYPYGGALADGALDGDPDTIYRLDKRVEPKVTVFPDAGCC